MDPEGLDRSSNSPLIRLAANPPVIDWRTCPPAPLAWIPLRELLLGLVHTPALLLPLAAALGLALAWCLQLSRVGTGTYQESCLLGVLSCAPTRSLLRVDVHGPRDPGIVVIS